MAGTAVTEPVAVSYNIFALLLTEECKTKSRFNQHSQNVLVTD